VKFTPGPWRVGKWNDGGGTPIVTPCFGEYGKEGQQIARVYGNWGNGNQQANAQLIAAAPDMRKALKEAQAYIRSQQPIWAKAEDLPPVMHTISQALAKAEGK